MTGDMSEWDVESYGAGYTCAEADIQTQGLAYAEREASRWSEGIGNPSTWQVGYITAVNAWREGVRL